MAEKVVEKGGSPALKSLVSEFGQRNEESGIKAVHDWVEKNRETLTAEKLERNLQGAKKSGDIAKIDSAEIALRSFELLTGEKEKPQELQPIADAVKGMEAKEEGTDGTNEITEEILQGVGIKDEVVELTPLEQEIDSLFEECEKKMTEANAKIRGMPDNEKLLDEFDTLNLWLYDLNEQWKATDDDGQVKILNSLKTIISEYLPKLHEQISKASQPAKVSDEAQKPVKLRRPEPKKRVVPDPAKGGKTPIKRKEGAQPKEVQEEKPQLVMRVSVSDGYIKELSNAGREITRLRKVYGEGDFLDSLMEDYEKLADDFKGIRYRESLSVSKGDEGLLKDLNEISKGITILRNMTRTYIEEVKKQESAPRQEGEGIIEVDLILETDGKIGAKEVNAGASRLIKVEKKLFNITNPQEILEKNRDILGDSKKVISAISNKTMRADQEREHALLSARLMMLEKKLADGKEQVPLGELSALYTDSLELKKFAIETTDMELEKTIASVETAYIALLELLKKPGILSHATELEAALEASDEILSLMMGPLSIGAGTIDEYCNAGREIDGKFKEIGKKYAPHIAVLEQAAKKAEKKK